MADATREFYQRLPGAGYRRIVPWWAILLLFFVIGIFALLLRGRRVRLWLGREHLLAVESDGYREHYKRFRYSDIQSLTIRKTPEGKAVSTILGGIAAIFAAMGLAVWNPGGTIALLIIGGIFGLVALVNFLSGPTCECHLRTAVQTEELVSLRRLRHALKVVERLRPLIVEAQGQFTVAEIYVKAQETLAAAEDLDAPPVIAAVRPVPAVKPPPRHYQSKVHFILFCLLAGHLPVTIIGVIFHSSLMTVIAVAHFLTVIAFAIIALVKQRNTDMTRTLKLIPWITVGTIALFVLSAVVYSVYLAMNDLRPGKSSPPSFADPYTIISTSISVILGVLGFIHLRKFHAAYVASSAPPPVTVPPTP